MLEKKYKDYLDFVQCVDDEFYDSNNKCEKQFITIIAEDYYEAKEIVKNLIIYDYDMLCVDLEEPQFDDYTKEYLIGVSADDFFCIKAYENDSYIRDDCDVAFVSNGANSAVLKSIHAGNYIAFEICSDELEKYECDKCGDCSIVIKKNGKELHGDEARKELSYFIDDYNKTIEKINATREEMENFEKSFWNKFW